MKLCPLCKRSWEDGFRVCPIDGLALQAAPADSDPYIGQTIGKASLVQKIADGDHGPIYRAEDPVYGATAVQIILPDRLASPVLMEAFEDAVKLASRLNHPNVVHILAMEHAADGAAAVLMEYVAGTNLDAYRRDHSPIDPQQAIKLVRDAAEGVLAAHRLSMLHGGLQPARILVTTDGTAKVGGFHRSGLRDDVGTSASPKSGWIYLAPECTGIIRDVPIPDYRADVYSLGAILHELLTGKTHYDAKNLQELGQVMQAGPPLPASFANPQISPTLSRVILKALSQYPADRHRSVEEFIREVDASSMPVREPERGSVDSRFSAPPRISDRDDSGLFAPVASQPGKEPGAGPWPAEAQGKKQGDESFFGWFKTRVETRGGSKGSERRRQEAEDSYFPRGAGKRLEEDSEERTVVVSGSKGRKRQRSVLDTFTNFGRNQDLTGTDALPRRRFSSKAYLFMAIAAVVVIGGIITLFLIFGRSAVGKLTLESTPSGAQVYLNEEYRGNTPLLIPELKADSYRLRLQMDGYESAVDNIDISANSDFQKSFVLIKLASPPLASLPPPLTPPPPLIPPPQTTGAGGRSPFEAGFNDALRNRSFFPPATGNAWDVLQSWRQKEGASAAAALEQSQQAFCRELERFGSEKLDQRDFQFARGLLEQIRNRMPGQSCAEGLQARFDSAISQSLTDLRSNLNAAMSRQNYVTPESDNALKYARLILHIDPTDAEAKSLQADILTRAIDQARAKSEARDHQEAIDIYLQLKNNYPNPPVGQEPFDQSIDRERRKLSLMTALKIPYSVQVRHDHSIFRLGNRECTGVLRIDGFTIEYQSTGAHSFKMGYDLLKSVSFSKGKIVFEGSTVPGNKIELEQVDKNPSPSLAEVYAKIEEYRKLRDQYMHGKSPAY